MPAWSDGAQMLRRARAGQRSARASPAWFREDVSDLMRSNREKGEHRLSVVRRSSSDPADPAAAPPRAERDSSRCGAVAVLAVRAIGEACQDAAERIPRSPLMSRNIYVGADSVRRSKLPRCAAVDAAGRDAQWGRRITSRLARSASRWRSRAKRNCSASWRSHCGACSAVRHTAGHRRPESRYDYQRRCIDDHRERGTPYRCCGQLETSSPRSCTPTATVIDSPGDWDLSAPSDGRRTMRDVIIKRRRKSRRRTARLDHSTNRYELLLDGISDIT